MHVKMSRSVYAFACLMVLSGCFQHIRTKVLDIPYGVARPSPKKESSKATSSGEGVLGEHDVMEEDDISEEKEVHNKHKRWIMVPKNKTWERGIVPYVFEDPEITKPRVIPNMMNYERGTCIRFVHHNQTWIDRNQGALRFVRGKGTCYAHLGNGHSKIGQGTNCCRGDTCMHELGHSFGASHEGNTPGSLYFKKDGTPEGRSKGYGDYDSTSVMNYPSRQGLDAGPHLRMFDINVQTKSNSFYLFKAVSHTTECKEVYCPDFKQNCTNDGFVTLVDGKCACNCPPGLDPATGCATVMKTASYKRRVWPKGQYAIPATDEGCPDDRFQLVTIDISTDKVEFMSKTPHIADSVSNGKLKLQLCVMDEKGNSSETDWPAGQAPFCFYRKGGTCPEETIKDVKKERFGFKEGNIDFNGDSSSSETDPGALPDGTFGESTRLTYCCKPAGFSHHLYPMKLPTSKPFALFLRGNSYLTEFEDLDYGVGNRCPKVDGMASTLSEVRFQPALVSSSKFNPLWVIKNKSSKIHYCYYSPENTDCGGEYELSGDKTNITIESPEPTQGHKCHWLFTSPPGTRMVLNFDRENTDRCADSFPVYIRRNLLGSIPFTPCKNFGNRRSFPTVYNKLMIDLVGKARFKATISLLDNNNMCYKMEDRGESYGGSVNYTRAMESCVPWGQALSCLRKDERENVFPRLDQNHCRMFGGDSLRPWCFHNAETCAKHYCDACHKESPWDTRDGCDGLKQMGFCENDPRARSRCAGTCKHILKGDNPATDTAPMTPVTCGRPDDLPGGSIVGKVESSYSVGDRVVYQCTGAPALWNRERVCLGTGQWTSLNYVCSDCPFGYSFLKGYCYKLMTEAKDFEAASDLCQSHNASLSPIETEKESQFLLSLWVGATTTGKDRAIWLGTSKIKNHWIYDPNNRGNNWDIKSVIMYPDGTVRKMTNWRTNLCFVCRLQSREASPKCEDMFDSCASVFEGDPSVCDKFPSLMNNCKKTCGLCGNVRCDVEQASENAKLDSLKSSLQQGEFANYSCKLSFVPVSGDGRRKCQKNGQLSGRTLQCDNKEEDTEIVVGPTTWNASSPGAPHKTFKAMLNRPRFSKSWTVPHDGEIIRWEFFSSAKGSGAFQVWREGGNNDLYLLVGQNKYFGVSDLEVKYFVPEQDRIQVKQGDFIGLYIDMGSGNSPVHLNPCTSTEEPNTLMNTKREMPLSQLIVNEKYHFMKTGMCLTPAFRAVVRPH